MMCMKSVFKQILPNFTEPSIHLSNSDNTPKKYILFKYVLGIMNDLKEMFNNNNNRWARYRYIKWLC